MMKNEQHNAAHIRAMAAGLRDGMGGHADECADLMEKLANDRAAAEQAQHRCQYCDGTGDVHSPTGEWLGACDCESFQQAQQGQPRCACGDSFTSDAVCANCLAAQQQAEPVAHSPIALQSIPKRQRDFTAENIRDIAHECMRIGDNEQAAVVFAIADALRDGNLTIHPAAVAVPDERCPHCCGSGVMPKAAIAPEPPDVPCRNCNGTGKVRRMLAAAPQAVPLSAALSDIAAERRRQMEMEGWTPDSDDRLFNGQLATAAGYYALAAGWPHERDIGRGIQPQYWPFNRDWWKPTTARRNLVKSGALIAAEIERLDRAAQKGGA